ncbi:WGxxGxxG-CTERM domain-containing protein [Microcoleus sp. FACHB-SPT15]|uniref:WGxxGxxG family protein n=1 Tax=Microcoleus sp. FACHB-SPT15 TaxID=2692830 RepID=UPI001785E922|nr:WGxxGxxG family protein [Microcoleus sp. FACHB-SPT15]MBD1805801.1 WGxxGxxG-CTERM domain-containing protein [Microcoleus sp. FACHB-SPT15]
MKTSKLSKLVGAGVIAASLAVVPLSIPAQAQDNAPDTSTEQNSGVDAVGPIADGTERDNNDWGWLGLLGLTGLAGLAGKKRKETVHHVDSNPDVVVRPGSDYRS